MPLRLKVQNTAEGDTEEVFLDQHQTRVGSSLACDISIPDEAVAEHQLSIIQDPHHILLAEGPSGTTTLNGERLRPNQLVKLHNKDRIAFGPVLIDVETVQPFENLILTDESNEQLRQMVWDKLSKHGFCPSAFIEIIAGLDAGHRATIPDQTEGFSIGSNPICDLTLKDPAALPIHLTIRQSELFFHAHPKKNAPVLINNVPLTGSAPLYHEDLITIGAQVLRFLDPPQKHAYILDPLAPNQPPEAPAPPKAPPVPSLVPPPPGVYNSLEDTFPLVEPPPSEPIDAPQKPAPDRILTTVAILLFVCSVWMVLLLFNVIAM